ncbi:nucleosome assembly protein [Medicago truncatula]|uniref:Nucleosome assembly protein n=1 Tax=Medicago truncatula TaxID=3880 RepID=G7IIL6_MEDTR|nr:nucleosome assembly protein [Medicago truncatula]
MTNDDNNVFPMGGFKFSLLNEFTNEGSRADHVDILEELRMIQALTQQRYKALQYLFASPIVEKRLEVLKEIQKEHDDLKAKFFEERAALEAKYQLLYQPLYTKRYEIVNGLAEVEGADIDEPEVKGVPYFWLVALQNNDEIADEITERDEDALKYLKDIKYTRTTEPQGFKLEFFFDSNPYFSNTILTKTYHMVDEDEFIMEKAIGTEIEWLPGKSLTEKKDPNTAKQTIETEKFDSFFNFFNSLEIPKDGMGVDEEADEELQNEMEHDYDIGSTIRDKIIPNAVSWYTGEASDGESGDLDDDDDDEDEEDDEEEVEVEKEEEDDNYGLDDDEEDDNEDVNNPKKRV